MRKAQIVDGAVANLIEVRAGAVPDWAAAWPDAPADVDIGYLWDGLSFRRPAVDIDAASAAARNHRDHLLATFVDPYAGNVLIWAGLHPLKQAEISAYRDALLDVTKQAGFPLNIVWPAVPVV